MESLEARTLMATAPLPVVSNQAQISSSGNKVNDSSPSIAIDPLDPLKMAAVYTERNTNNGTAIYGVVEYSTDGGVTWNFVGNEPSNSGDPTSTTGAVLQDYTEGVGFDRSHHFYVGILETNNSNAGDVVVDKYDFTTASPVQDTAESYFGTGQDAAVYRWDQAVTGQNLQPTVLNFSMAVDDNVASYSDPTTGQTQSDPNSGAVYIAWTLNTPPPQGAQNWNPDTIQVVASPDGVSWPSSGPNGDSGALSLGFGNFGGQRYTAPALAVSQGKVGKAGGQISVIWDDFTSGNNANPPVDLIDFAPVTYTLNKAAGIFKLASTNPTGTTILTTTVRGALGAPYPLNTPSSPLGIGPGAQIAVDNTLGSFSTYQGRIYVTYVDRSTAAGNPSDNTDIYLIASDDNGQTWFNPSFETGVTPPVQGSSQLSGLSGEQVDDDVAILDGHTAGDPGLQGRPQYEPSIAVDATTGSVVMSWLDVRDDPSLSRYADYLGTSIDGGASFSPQTFADQPNVVTDAATGKTFVAGPYSGNESGGNPNAETSLAFGTRQGLAVADGVIHPIWATTYQDGLQNKQLSIETAQATLPAGPRVVSGTEGPTSSPSLSSFTVTFDRPVDVSTFTPSQVRVQFLNAATGAITSNDPTATDFDPTLAIASVVPLDSEFGGAEATDFVVNFSRVQTAVGTYSYAIGPDISDLMRAATATTINTASLPLSFTTPASPLPQPIADGKTVDGTDAATSTIAVSGAKAGDSVVGVTVNNLSINYPTDSNLTINLTSPGGTTVQLASGDGGTSANFTNTNFSDTAPGTIAAGSAPFTGTYKPNQPLATFLGGAVNGNWTLTVVDAGTGAVIGSLTGWSLTITTAASSKLTYGAPSSPLPQLIADGQPPTTSSTTVTSTPAVTTDVVKSVTVNVSMSYPTGAPLTLTLTAPNGAVSTLAAGVGNVNQAFTTAAFAGDPIDGKWTLSVIDAATGTNVGTLTSWSLAITPGAFSTSTSSTGDLMDQNANGVGGEAVDYYANPAPLSPTANPFTGPYDTTTLPIIIAGPHVLSTSVPESVADGQAPATSTITVSGALAGDTVQSVTVGNLSISYPQGSTPLTIKLTSPDGVVATLATGVGSQAGATFTTAAFAGDPRINGAWTLSVVDASTGQNVGSLAGWSLSIATANAATLTFSAPTLIPIADPTGSAQQGQNLLLNGTVSSIDVTFDRPMDPSTLVGGNPVLTITGPTGPIDATNFTVVADPQAGEDPSFPQTYKIEFLKPGLVNGAPGLVPAVQSLSGTYALTLSTTTTFPNGTVVPIRAKPSAAGLHDGAQVDNNQNAGVDLLFNNQSQSNQTVFAAQQTNQDIFLGFGYNGISNQSQISVPAQDTNRIKDFSLTLNFSNPSNDPVTATLTTPGNQTITLFSGITTANLNNVTFNDSAAATLPNGVSTGTFKPAQSFLTNGQLLNALESGNYTLTLSSPTSSNPNFFDIGVLNSWSITVTAPTPVQSAPPTTFAGQQATGQSWAITPATPLVTSITIPAGDNALIQDFSLALNITYPNDPDLTATLTTPIINPVTGKPYTVLLFSGNGSASGSQANFTNTVFNDGAATSINNGAPPFFGQFQPLQSFLVDGQLLGKSEAGTYTLTITDNAAPGSTATGTLNGWSITTTPKVATNTGLGEAVADQTALSFRIFTMDPTNPLSSNTWTAVGPASNNNQGNSGRVSGIAVDSSDPSGNTVYVTGASGGVWKTTDFLTTNLGGPTYVPLTGNSGANSLNIGSIAVYSRNGDPNQSIIVAGTGEGNTSSPGVQGSSTVGTSKGVGFLISYDGGKTWTLEDSLVNYDAGGHELPESQRKHDFFGTTTFKVLVDPHPAPDGNVIMYAALGGGAAGSSAVGGVYRSLDSGHTWALMRGGLATDIVFDPNSDTVNAVSNPTGNIRTLYAAFEGDGVYLTPNQGQTWNEMVGGTGDPLVQNLPNTGKKAPVPVNAPGNTPNGTNGRIVLAKPAPTGNALLDAEYETWLYAVVVTPGGALQGIYLTKDNGANWTTVRIPNAEPATATQSQGLDPSNNIGQPDYNVPGAQGNYDIAVAVDPNNPNVIYVGGSADFGPSTMIRVDTARLSDPYSLYASTETAGGQILQNTTSPVTIKDPTKLQLFGLDPLSDPYTNLYRDPFNIFTASSVVTVHDTGSFANDGSGAWYTPMDGFISGTDVHTIVSVKDPVTGKTRLLVGYDQGIATAVDDGTGTELASIGGTPLATGVANGNLQITQFYNGAAQPSALAAQIAGALFYGEAQDDGFPTSDPGVLANGNIGWFGSTGDGTDVHTDQTGTGTNYQSTWPCCNTLTPDSPNDFFQVNGIGRTFGLIQSTSVNPGAGLPSSSDPQWGVGPSYNFAVNPITGQQMIFGSGAGRLFGTEDQGLIWYVLADPSTFDSTTIPALAYGAPDPNGPGVKGALDNYMIAGTSGGHIYVTFTGGGGGTISPNAWIPLSAGLDGAPVERIVTDPTRGTHDAYAITTDAVYYNADTSAANSTWVNVTGNLFSIQTTPFGDANLTRQQLILLSGLAVDWRYVIPFNPANPAAGNHPLLYVGGLGGVFRSTDNGTTWTDFPDQTLNTPVPLGNLPTTSVTDLDMVLGNVDPTTGHPDVSTGPNLLLATTYGTGSYGIRLAPIVFNGGANVVGLSPTLPAPGGSDTGSSKTDKITNDPAPYLTGVSEQTAFGSQVAITVVDVTNPAQPFYVGGYNAVPGESPTSNPTFTNPADDTNASGQFNVQANYAALPGYTRGAYDGVRTIEVYATDASGTQGNIVTYSFTLETIPPATPAAPVLDPASDSSKGHNDTNVTSPVLDVTPTAATLTASTILLFRKAASAPASAYVQVATAPLPAQSTATVKVTDPGPVQPDGRYTYAAEIVDLAGNISPISPDSGVITIDTTPPVTPPAPVLVTDSSHGRDITNVNDPTFTVATGEFTPTVTELLIAGNPLGTGAMVVGTNATATTLPIQVSDPNLEPDGTYYYFAEQVDQAGNHSPLSTGTKVQILTAFPPGPGVPPTVALLPGDDSGVKGDAITDVTQPHLYGSAPVPPAGGPGYTLQLVRVGASGNTVLTSIPDPNNGQYIIQFPAPLADGTYKVLVQAVDVAGNVSASLPLTLTINTSPPKVTPTINILASEQFPAGNPNQTIVHQLVVYGQTDPGATIGIYDGHLNLVGQATAQQYNLNGHPAGYYQAQIQANVYDGSLQLYAFAHSVAGVGDPQYGSLTLKVTTVEGDYNGDGKADLAIYTPSTGEYVYGNSGTVVTTFLYNYGVPNVDIPVPGDYDGDGKVDPALYRPTTGNWIISGSRQGAIILPPILAPGSNVIPVPAAFDADGQSVPAVYVTTTSPGLPAGTWVIDHNVVNPSSTASTQVVSFGLAGDTPVPADYDGAGSAQVAVYRPSTGTWYVRSSATGKQEPAVTLPGLTPQPTDVPVPGDYDGIGRAEEAVYRPSTEQFFIYNPISKTTRTVQVPSLQQNGSQVVIPVPAAYSGDGKVDPGVYNQSTGQWEYINSVTGQVFTQTFVLTSHDIPLPAPIQYRLAAYGGATPAIARSAAVTPAFAPAAIVGAATPAGSTPTSRGTAPATVARSVSPTFATAPVVGNALPAQAATDSAIASLGKSYKGIFI